MADWDVVSTTPVPAAPTQQPTDPWAVVSHTPMQASAQPPAPQPRTTWGSATKNFGAGAEEGLTGLVGMASDFMGGNAVRGAADIVGDLGGPKVTIPTGQEIANKALGLVGLNPEDVKANTTAEKVARYAGAGLSSAIAPEAAAGKLGATAAEIIANVARTGITGMASGIGSGEAAEHVPGPYKDIASLAGGLGAGVTTGAAVSGRMMPRATPDAQTLINKGVTLTPGQMFGPTMKSIEDRLTSIPLIGDVIKYGQRKSIESLNRVVLNKALQPIGGTIPANMKMGYPAVDHVHDLIDTAYDNLLPNLTATRDPQLDADFNTIKSDLTANGAKPETIQRVDNVLKGQIDDRAMAGGNYDGQRLKNVQEGLRGVADDHLKGNPSVDDKHVGYAILDAKNAFNAMIERQNPSYGPQLRDVNNAYAQYARIRKASSSVGSKDGVFSPAQYASAIKSQDTSVGKGNYARGKAFGQDISAPANKVMPQQVPDSGTAGRYLTDAALMGGLGYVSPYSIPPLAALGSFYTGPGMRALGRAATGSPSRFPAAGLIPAALPPQPHSKGGFI